jgi:hypothetical protein
MFKENYKKIALHFQERFITHHGEPYKKVDWPKGFGVYVVWETGKAGDRLIYIGLTGKFKKIQSGACAINSGRFSNRRYRWTPYFFQESDVSGSAFVFKYGPKYSNNAVQFKSRFETNAYSDSVNYGSLRLDFFVFSENVQENYGYTPSLLEAQLLTDYLIENNQLPPANFEI